MPRSRIEDRYHRPKTFRRIVFISGDNTRTYTVNPLVLFGGLASALVLSVGMIASTGYLVFRDDVFDMIHARNAAMQQAYEDRIGRLRSEIDKISSRQILDQVALDDKIEHMMSAQQNIANRQRMVSDLIDKAAALGLVNADGSIAPDKHVEADPTVTGSVAAYADDVVARDIESRFAALTDVPPLRDGDGNGKGKNVDFQALAQQLANVDRAQTQAVASIAEAVNKRTESAINVLASLGVEADLAPLDPKATSDDAVGGPYVALGSAEALRSAVMDASAAFDRLQTLKTKAARLPLARPLPNADMTSNFGSRRDPFLGSLAFHAGIDFRTPTGTPIKPTAAGVVVNAGWSGGYGNMVEVDHGNGISTRYGHLSAISTRVGARVTPDTVIGEAGSTGRSTGPHLHYETRVNGTAINPVTFLNAGLKLAGIFP